MNEEQRTEQGGWKQEARVEIQDVASVAEGPWTWTAEGREDGNPGAKKDSDGGAIKSQSVLRLPDHTPHSEARKQGGRYVFFG